MGQYILFHARYIDLPVSFLEIGRQDCARSGGIHPDRMWVTVLLPAHVRIQNNEIFTDY